MSHETFAAFGTVSGNSNSDILSVDIPEGQSFTLEQVVVKTVADPAGDVEVGTFSGDRRVAPTNGTATMANDDITLPASEAYDVGDTLRVNVAKTTTGSIDVSVRAVGLTER